MILNQILAIVRKELQETRRTSTKYAAMALVFSTYLQWFIVRNYVSMAKSGKPTAFSPSDILAMAPTFSLIFVAPMVIPFFANALLSRSFIREQLLGSLMPILATGVDAGLLWASKVVAAFIASYVVAVAALLADIVLITFYFHLTITWSLQTVVVVLVMSPLCSLAILAIMSFLYWTVKAANLVSSILPIVVSMGLFAYASAHPVTQLVFGSVLLVAMGSILVIFLLSLAVNKLSRQFIVGI